MCDGQTAKLHRGHICLLIFLFFLDSTLYAGGGGGGGIRRGGDIVVIPVVGEITATFSGKYWTDFVKTFMEYVKSDYFLRGQHRDHWNFPHSLGVVKKKCQDTKISTNKFVSQHLNAVARFPLVKTGRYDIRTNLKSSFVIKNTLE